MNSDFARQQMVKQQIRAWDVFDEKILALLEEMPRERFVPPGFAGLAYADTQIPLPHNQVMMAPKVEGRLLQALDLEPEDTVLEIGTGSGFLTACLARLANKVVSIDIFDDLLDTAKSNLEREGVENVVLESMDAMVTLPEGQFDAIAVTGSVAELETRFVDALRPGGRLFLIVGEPPIMEALLLVRDTSGGWHSESLFETAIRPLIHAHRKPVFEF